MGYKHGLSEEEGPQVLVQTIHRQDDIPDSVRAVFARDADIDWRLGGENMDGFTNLPGDYRDFIVSLRGNTDRMASEIFNLVRWRMGIVGGPLDLQSEWSSMRWHDDSKGENVIDEDGFLNRQIIAGAFTLHMSEMQDVDFREGCRLNVENLIQLQSTQPLFTIYFVKHGRINGPILEVQL
jgi:hypothetical protein